MTQWVGEAWTSIHQELQHTIRRSFRKCGITVAIDGSEDSEIHIRGLDNYAVPAINPLESLLQPELNNIEPCVSLDTSDLSDADEFNSDSDTSEEDLRVRQQCGIQQIVQQQQERGLQDSQGQRRTEESIQHSQGQRGTEESIQQRGTQETRLHVILGEEIID